MAAPFVILVLIMSFKSDFIIKKMVTMPWGYDNVYAAGYLAFFLIFSYYFIWAFVNLIKKYLVSEGVIKRQLCIVIFSFGLAAIFGMVFDLFLPYFGNWKLNWLGPYFTIFIMLGIADLIFIKNK